jgi:hypothetical protein
LFKRTIGDAIFFKASVVRPAIGASGGEKTFLELQEQINGIRVGDTLWNNLQQ